MLEEFAPNVYQVAEILKSCYKDFDHYNRKNPLDELLYIIFSLKTDENKYLSTYRSLKSEFPRFNLLASAETGAIAKQIIGGGLYNQKSATIKNIMKDIVERFGKPTLAPLKKMPDKECEDFLTSLPGVGKKAARCVMLYSLERHVFPVDTHCWRICLRLGWEYTTRPDRTCSPKDMDRLQSRIPRELRFSLHVNMVSHGREICTPKKPKCSSCPISNYCPKIGVIASETIGNSKVSPG